MKTITSDYDTHTKDELLAEAKERGLEGVNTSTNKPDIIAALQLDDEGGSDASKESETQDKTGRETPIVRNNPVVASKEVNPAMPDPKDYKGSYVCTADGETYGLAIVETDNLGRTHKLRNDLHFWEGTKDEFKAQFEKAE